MNAPPAGDRGRGQSDGIVDQAVVAASCLAMMLVE
jgi:hypothetical protein